jgi:hypothetical protein
VNVKSVVSVFDSGVTKWGAVHRQAYRCLPEPAAPSDTALATLGIVP